MAQEVLDDRALAIGAVYLWRYLPALERCILVYLCRHAIWDADDAIICFVSYIGIMAIDAKEGLIIY